MFGGQSIQDFDRAMAIGVRRTFKKELCTALQEVLDYNDIENVDEIVLNIPENILLTYKNVDKMEDLTLYLTSVIKDSAIAEKCVSKAYKIACKRTEKETHQAMEAVIFNLNSMHCLPANEKIPVIENGRMKLISMEELHDNYAPNKYQVLSLNPKTGNTELKYINGVKRQDNHRRLITLKTNNGAEVTTTDNHKIMYLNNCGEISENYPEKLPHMIAPRNFSIQVKNDISLDHYHSRKSQNYALDHIVVTEEFAKLAGYYVADGSCITSVLCFSVCDKNKENELIQLMKTCYGENVTWNIYPTKEGKPHDIRFNVGKVWTDCFKDKFGANAREKRIAEEILFAHKEIKVAFLNGYLKCDGRIANKYVDCSTVSELLFSQLQLMVLSMNEIPHVNIRHSIDKFTNRPYVLYTLGFGCNTVNRLGLEFNMPKVRAEMKYYDFNFLNNTITKNWTGRKINRIDKFYIDTETNLECAQKVFPSPIKTVIDKNSEEMYVYDISVEGNETFLTRDCMFVHNSRAGSQVPFSSLNFGLDTSPEGRLAMEKLLLAQEAGLGHGEISIFPITIFRLKEGISYNPEDPNYDLFKLAMRVSAKRLFPNFENQDAPYNMKYYDPNDYRTEIATMGKCKCSPCKTV